MIEIPLVNPGFETGSMSGWTYVYSGGHNTMLTVVSNDKYEGVYSIYHSCPFAGIETSYVKQTIDDWEQYKGKDIVLSAWTKLTNFGSGDSFRLYIYNGYDNSALPYGYNGYFMAAWGSNQSEWGQRSLPINLPSGSTYLEIRLYMYNSSSGASPYGWIDLAELNLDVDAPTVTTEEPTNVTSTTATGNGTIVDDGGETITAHGMVWAPDEDDAYLAADDGYPVGYTDEGAGAEGAFTSAMTGFGKSTGYYVRAYATNEYGTGYGNAIKIYTDPSAGVLLAFDNSILATDPDWTDVSEDMMLVHIKRGRMHDLDKVDAGTCTIELDNSSGNYWRNNTGGDYYPNVKPLILNKITLTYKSKTYTRFHGIVESIKHRQLQRMGGLVPIVQINCIDAFKSLNRLKLKSLTGTTGSYDNVGVLKYNAASGQADLTLNTLADDADEGVDIDLLHVGQSITIGDDDDSEVGIISAIDEGGYVITLEDNLTNSYSAGKHAYIKKFPQGLPGQRIKDCLAEFDWPSTRQNIDDGRYTIAELVPPQGGTPGLEHMFDVADSDEGLFFINQFGHPTFQDAYSRIAQRGNTLAEDLDTSETDVTVTDGTDYRSGDIVKNPLYDELMLVTDVAINTLTVIRGFDATTPVEHTNGDDLLVMNYTTVMTTFSDDTDDQLFVVAEPEDDDTYIYNQAGISGDDLEEQIYRDLYYQETLEQGVREFTRKESLLISSGDAFNQAYVIVERYKDSKLRVPLLKIFPDADPDSLYPKIGGYDIGTKINLEINESPNPAGIDIDYHIEGIEEIIRPGMPWEVIWQLWDVNYFRIVEAQHTGYLYKNNLYPDTYEDCHDATDADAFEDDDVLIPAGQANDSLGGGMDDDWKIYRGFMEFDTSVIGSDATILGAEVILEIDGYYQIDNEFDLTIVSAGSVAYPLESGDYNTLMGQTNSFGSVTIGTPDVNIKVIVITLSAAGLAAISKTGVTRFGLRSSRDISETAPGTTGQNKQEWLGVSGTGMQYVPRLAVKLSP